MGVTVRNNRLDDIARELAIFEKIEILVGFQGPQALRAAEDGATVVEIAVFNEFGTESIPARPFLSSAMDMGQDQLSSLTADLLLKISGGDMKARAAAERLGILAQSLVRKRIVELDTPPNSAATVRLKDSSNPLIDTGQMMQSVTYVVREGSTAVAQG